MKLKVRNAKLALSYGEIAMNGITVEFADCAELDSKYAQITNKKFALYENLTESGAIALTGDNILVSLGDSKNLTLTNLVSIADKLAEFIGMRKISAINLVFPDALHVQLNIKYSELVEMFLIDFINGLYYFDEFKTDKKPLSLASVHVVCKQNLKPIIHNVSAIISGYHCVRNLANTPSNVATPTFLADTAVEFTKISDKVKVSVLDKKAISKLGMNAFLGVAKGSQEEPKFIIMEYYGGEKNASPCVLVGKGITFDSGGISLKPRANMDNMKYDMCGAATVIGVFEAVAKLGLPINLVSLVATCENMPSSTAQKPGDIVTTMSGKTVEILNTDAEGRLILCDALHYAKRYAPKWVIDVATLTGACVVALGSVASGLYVNDEDLYQQIQDASIKSSDKVWRMPLFNEYKTMIKGKHADLSNIGGWEGKAGSITAASFLAEFVDYTWAHLDIAGVAYGNEYDGSSGRPFKLLVELIRKQADILKAI